MPRRPNPLTEVASVTQRVAVLLAAGVPPSSAWGYAAASSPSTVARAAAEAAPDSIAEAIAEASVALPALDRGAWRALAAAWSVATSTGAPLAPSLLGYASSLRALAHVQRQASVALAGPAATARLVMVLPIVGILFGLGLGFDTIHTLFVTPVGWCCLAVGAGLLVIARRWNSRLVASATPRDPAPGLECDLLAIALSGGASIAGARSRVAEAAQTFGLQRHDGGIEELLALSAAAGVPAGDLLRSEAEEARREAAAAAEEKAAALAVRLMLPLGLCVLPSFMVLGVVPLLVTVISSTVNSSPIGGF
jgi:tight adherence protein B